MYSVYSGYSRPFWKQILCTTLTVLAVAGWIIAIVFILSIIFGFFDELLITLWEVVYGY